MLNFYMPEIEKYFECPYCGEQVSIVINLLEEGEIESVEDCFVCCNPIKFVFTINQEQLIDFSAEEIGQ